MAAAAGGGGGGIGHRSGSIPLRLQQILSGGARSLISPALKLESEPPPKVKNFLDKVMDSPLHDIAIPLSSFSWDFNKGNFDHWRPLFIHFDSYFKTYIAKRKDLLLDIIPEDDPFPKNCVLQILRVMQIILENCPNKTSFGGFEHFGMLLASTDPEIVVATLETLSTLVKINFSKIHVGGKLVECGSMNSSLLSLAQGWGSKEEGLGIYSCIAANEETQPEGLSLFPTDSGNRYDHSEYRLGSTLHFEFSTCTVSDCEQIYGRRNSSNVCVIHIPDLHLSKEDDLSIFRHCVQQYNVPPEHRFTLLTRIRYARSFCSPRTGRLYSRICLLAFIVLVQSGDAHEELTSFFTNEPEYTNELIRLVRSEGLISGSTRSLSMLALGAQLAAYASSHERARILNGSSIISAGGNRMVLLSVLQKAILSLSNPTDPSSVLFVGALLQFFLLHVLSSSSSGNSLRGTGMVPPLLLLLQDNEPAHIHLVCLAVKSLQKLMEYSSPAVSLFKDLGGVELLTQRLHIEIHWVIGQNMDFKKPMAVTVMKSDENHLDSKKRLIRMLLKAMGSATYSPTNPTRSQSSLDSSLPAILALLFHNVEKFGGDIYSSAVSVMSEMIHRDPTCFPVLEEVGLPNAFLSSVASGVLPSSKAIRCVPNGLGAICLNSRGLEAVGQRSALRFLIDIFTSRKYALAMNDGVVPLANAVEEFLRHVSSLRSAGVDIIIEIINSLSAAEECKADKSCATSDESTDMETDLGNKSVERRDLVCAMNSHADGITDEQFVHLSIFHAMVLVHRTMENAETCRLFVDKGGIETLFKLLLRPNVTQSTEGMPIAMHSAMVFKSFTQQHSVPLARAFCSFLRQHLKITISEINSASSSFLLDPKYPADSGPFSSLFVIEFLLFLAASKDTRWMTALLSEFGDASRDVLEDIGKVQREVLWQIALLEGSKNDADSEPISADEEQRVDAVEDNRFSLFRQHLDPLTRRRTSAWNFESQLSDIISMHREGRSSIGSLGVGMERYSNVGTLSGSADRPSSSSDSSSSGKMEEEKRSFYNSCRTMMRSLAYHINQLFLELGTAMLLPSRRESNPVTVSPSVVSVAGVVTSIVLEHLNFEGHTQSTQRDSCATKSCYLGKVINFIDILLADRAESCNGILLNSFYCRGVIQAILTTFEATCGLPFSLNHLLSPMEMDSRNDNVENDKMDFTWLNGSLASYGSLLDHLVTSSFVLSSTTKQLLEQPIWNSSAPCPQDAATFMKVLQSQVLKCVLPVWSSPRFADYGVEFIASMTSIISHVYCGVEVKNVRSNVGTHLAGPPPDENAISLIVEMGFSRARAEEALRQVGTNSVEIATDWLFSHPEEPQEDAELARALAMSLGNNDGASKEEDAASGRDNALKEEAVPLPSVENILASSVNILQAKESLAFPVRNMLVTICSENDGQNRVKVVAYIIDQIKECCRPSGSSGSSLLPALFHLLALILHEDAPAREVAFKFGLVKVALDLLSGLDFGVPSGDIVIPKWFTPCLLSVERMLHREPKLPDINDLEFLRGNNSNGQPPVAIGDENKKKDLPSASVLGLVNMDCQRKILEICCNCIRQSFPSESMHVVLQLCATLTKVHSLAVNFLDLGGLHGLLSLQASSLFPGFNRLASATIRHILEDPHTLQQAMEQEIRYTLTAAANRHANPRVTPRNFVQSLTVVFLRDPEIFMKAAKAVCQIETVGDRPYVVLLKEREKDKSKEKDKEKSFEKDKSPTSDRRVSTDGGDPLTTGGGFGKIMDANAKNAKLHRKSPHSFVAVIEHLLDFITSYVPPPKAEKSSNSVPSQSAVDMDIDVSALKDKGKAIAVSEDDSKNSTQEASSSLAKAAFVLKLLADIILTYTSSIQVVLRRDAEVTSIRGPPVVSMSDGTNGGIFHHILHKFLPCHLKQKKEKKNDGDWWHRLAVRASNFLVASSIRSAEARKRIFSAISMLLIDFVDSSNGCKVPDFSMNFYVDLLNDILSARSPSGSYVSGEAAITFVESGLVRSLTRVLQVLDLDHLDSPRIVTGIVKALELVTKEHVHSAELNAKGDNSNKLASDGNQIELSYNDADGFRSSERPSHQSNMESQVDLSAVQASGSSDTMANDMDHDLDDNFAHDGEDDFMHEMSEDGAGNDADITTVELRFDIPQDVADEMADDDDEDDDMSEDDEEDVDEEDDDDEENHELEENEVHHLAHPDSDQEDHEVDEDYDEDLFEEDDDDGDDDGVILRLEEGINGINVLDHIEVLGGNNNFGGDTLRVDIFDSRRHGRTTSIYNLLGGRSSEHATHSEHPLLEEPSPARHIVNQRRSEDVVDLAFADRNNESSSSRLYAFFRTLRGGRNGHRFNMWLDDTQHLRGSAAPTAPQGLEDLLISQLWRAPAAQPASENDANVLQDNNESDHTRRSENEASAGLDAINEAPALDSDPAGSASVLPPDSESVQRDASSASEQVNDMQFERTDASVRDVEAFSQASSGSGATLGESLRSLEVEIGSVEGHDEGDRPAGGADRLPLADFQTNARVRRMSASTIGISGRDMALESVNEMPQNLSPETQQDGAHEEQGSPRRADTDSIDPTFLDALPEDLRAEVLSSRQNQAGQSSGDQPQADGDIDPEFLAALPPDIREEVLAQQRAQRLQQSQELEGQPVEMDTVSIIATFPSDIREEVLLTSPDTLLATLTPALVAEANMLRERFAHRYHSSALFNMNSRNRRGESSRRGDLIGSTVERSSGDGTSRQASSRMIETDGAPLVDSDALKSLVRLLQVVQLMYKNQLHRLLLNLCAHRDTRASLVRILVDMLMLDLFGSAGNTGDARQVNRLYGCQSNIAYSRPQSSCGVPPLLSRRILETLTNLSTHPSVAKLLLYLDLPHPSVPVNELHNQGRGKAVMMDADSREVRSDYVIVLLLSLLNHPLYMRSVAHLEQLLTLLKVVIKNADSEAVAQGPKPDVAPENPNDMQISEDDNQDNANKAGPSVGGDAIQNAASSTSAENNLSAVLSNLPQAELCLLCALLAREGLSDNAYVLVAEVLKKVVNLSPAFCNLFIRELATSMQNLILCATNELQLYEDASKALLSSSSGNGTAILRVLQALSSLVITLEEKKDAQLIDKDHADALAQISDINSALESLWFQLSNSISRIETSSEYLSDLGPLPGNTPSVASSVSAPLPAGMQNILPYIESFFVTCEKLRSGQSEISQDTGIATSDNDDMVTSLGGQRSSGSSVSFDERHNAFIKFSEKHRKLLNAFIRQNPGLLEKSFSLMLKAPRLIDFDNKRSYFRSKIKLHHDHHHSPVRISVRRAYILEDSYNQLRMRLPQELKGRLTVHFQGEEGIDAGGLTREWYQLLSRVIFDKNALLFTTVGNDSTFQPNPNSVYQTEHLSYFKFVGRVVGKALFDGQLLDVHFTRSFYKHILGVKVTYHDIEAIDPDYYKNLKWMLENDISDILDLTFSMDADEEKRILYEKAQVTDSELIPGGRNIRVTEENKHEYVNRVAEHRLTTAIRPQINAFMEGFSEMIPRDLIAIFNDKELELLISGLPDIDLDDLKANTEYFGYSIASPIIQWFWEVVHGLSKEDRARFLQFVTGTSKVPLEGFNALQGISGAQKFQIHKAYGSIQHLPSAHTCFNQLDLPEYTSKEQLQERLLLAIHEAYEGFGFG